jgi:hypothetical protein
VATVTSDRAAAPGTATGTGRRRLSATALAQYVRFGNCDRLLYFLLHPERAAALEARWRISAQPLTPLLHATGEAFEERVVAGIRAAGETVVSLAHRRPETTLTALHQAAAGRRLVLTQAPLIGDLGTGTGSWPCGGTADLICLLPGADGLRVTVADVKASLNERVEHRLQVAFYVRLLRQMAARGGVPLAAVEGAVLHREEHEAGAAAGPASPEAGEGPPITVETLPPFDLGPYDLALDHLLGGAEAVVARVAAQPFDEVPFSLSFKCDGCLFNAHCMHESNARERLALVPHITPAETRLLRAEGVDTFRDLAGLTAPAPPGRYHGPLDPAPGREADLDRLRSHWQLGGLDRLTQRARALLRARERATVDPGPAGAPGVPGAPPGTPGTAGGAGPGAEPEARPAEREPAIDAPFSTLPDEAAHPGLVKVFFDAQHDYVRDGVYLLAALVQGPEGERVVLERTAGPVDREAEGDLLERWVPRVYGAVVAASGASEAFVHLYTFSRQDQSVLLAALRRHVGRLPAIGALFDLLTDDGALARISPLAQPMLSFLSEEVRERRTLDLTCTSLQAVASRMGFRWTGPARPAPGATGGSVRAVDFQRRFRARVFDGRRLVPLDDPNGRRTWIESAARFRSQIPLEYAYGAWEALPASTQSLQARLLQPYVGIAWDELEGFAVHRLRALVHVEERLRPKSRFAGKQRLPLLDLTAVATAPPGIPRALQDFLLIEHHARTQELLLGFAQPVERRVQTGRAMLLECLEYRELGGGQARATGRVVFEPLGLDPVLAAQALRFDAGSWVVVNPHAETTPSRLRHGRLATVESVTREADGSGALRVELALKPLSFGDRAFAYTHRSRDSLRPGDHYTVDEMADDLNGDKLLAACRAAGDPNLRPNALLRWIEAAGAAGAGAPPPPVASLLETIAAVEAAAGGAGPTARQREAIAGGGGSVLLIQGPPGSGKSHTLGWAVLVRLAAARLAGAPALRVAVSSKTHNAIGIVLSSVAEKLARLRRHAPDSAFAAALSDLRLVKVGSEDAAAPGTGAEALHVFDPYLSRGEIESLLATPWLVLGATPGGLYNLQKYRPTGGKDLPWEDRPFGLVVLDEASQVNVPEALLACAFLDPHGQAVVVGDHRQMPPIVAVTWNEEARRTVVDNEVYGSVFDFLRARPFRRVGLDESFRLPSRLAAFLEEIIYRQDGIPFYSRRDDPLPRHPTGDSYVDAVLDPRHPVVVVEHEDSASQQVSQVELDLLTPLLETCAGPLGLDGASGIGVVVPHRAQRALLRARFPALAAANAIDTVERFQGGERDVIVVSATASDPDYILSEADFLLNPNRLNVALSRPRRKLIVVASGVLLRLLTSDPDLFEQATLWKRLRYAFASAPLWAGTRAGTTARVFGSG